MRGYKSTSCGASVGFLTRYDGELRVILAEDSLEGLMLKLQYFSHLMQRTDSLIKTLMLGKIAAFPLGWPWEAQSSPRVANERVIESCIKEPR